MKRLTGLIVVLLTLLGVAVEAQGTPGPLVMLVNGADLWQSFPAGQFPVRLTVNGYVDRPYLSPDGTRIAYKVTADIGIKALQQTGGLVSELPSDLEIRTLGSAGVLRFVTQPSDATYDAGSPNNAVIRSAPGWSPDSARLAWTEEITPGSIRRLTLYDIASNTTLSIATDLPVQNGFQQTMPVRWGTGGIALLSTVSDPDNAATGGTLQSILFYSPDGTHLSTAPIRLNVGEYLYDFEWISAGGVDKLGLIYSTGRWDVIDPADGSVSPLTGVAQLYSLTNPNGLALDFGVTNLPDRGPSFTWTAIIPGAPSIPLTFTGPIEWITISPVGDSIAYADGGIAYVWHDGQASEVPGTNPSDLSAAEMVWGPVGWRSHPG